jgi:hypothetical protein
MSAASPLNVIRTVFNAGIALTLTEERRLCCCVSPERARCFMIPIIAAASQATGPSLSSTGDFTSQSPELQKNDVKSKRNLDGRRSSILTVVY